jgi:hypothetical protein
MLSALLLSSVLGVVCPSGGCAILPRHEIRVEARAEVAAGGVNSHRAVAKVRNGRGLLRHRTRAVAKIK